MPIEVRYMVMAFSPVAHAEHIEAIWNGLVWLERERWNALKSSNCELTSMMEPVDSDSEIANWKPPPHRAPRDRYFERTGQMCELCAVVSTDIEPLRVRGSEKADCPSCVTSPSQHVGHDSRFLRVEACGQCRSWFIASDKDRNVVDQLKRMYEILTLDKHLRLALPILSRVVAVQLFQASICGGHIVHASRIESLADSLSFINGRLCEIEREIAFPHRLNERFGARIALSLLGAFVNAIGHSTESQNPILAEVQNGIGARAASRFAMDSQKRTRKRLMKPPVTQKDHFWAARELAKLVAAMLFKEIKLWRDSKVFLVTFELSKKLEMELEQLSGLLSSPASLPCALVIFQATKKSVDQLELGERELVIRAYKETMSTLIKQHIAPVTIERVALGRIKELYPESLRSQWLPESIDLDALDRPAAAVETIQPSRKRLRNRAEVRAEAELARVETAATLAHLNALLSTSNPSR